MERLKHWSIRCVQIGALLWLAIHFVLTVAYVMPVNPIKMKIWPLLAMTIGAYFSQNWSLFAPNPARSDQALLVRCLTEPEAAGVKAHGLPVQGWHDLSTPLWREFQRHRFSGYDRAARPQTNAIRHYLGGSVGLASWVDACRKGSQDACKFALERLKDYRAEAAGTLEKIGSAFCRDREVGRAFTQVALRARETYSVPWSRRYSDEKPTSKDFELGVYPLDRTIETTRLFRTGAL